MTTKLNQLKEKESNINAQVKEWRERKITDATAKKHLEDLKQINKDLAEVKKEIAKEELKIKVANVNKTIDDLYDLLEQLKPFKSNHLLAQGGRTKKYKEFLEGVKTDLYFYESYNGYNNNIEIKVSDKYRNSFYINYKDGEYTLFREYKKIDFQTVYKARKERNNLLKQMQELKSKLSNNYAIATGDYNIEDFNKDYEISYF